MPLESNLPELRFSRDKHVEPQSLKNYKANKTKALAEQANNLNDNELNHVIAPDIWQLIRQKANNASEMAKMNGVLRVLLA